MSRLIWKLQYTEVGSMFNAHISAKVASVFHKLVDECIDYVNY